MYSQYASVSSSGDTSASSSQPAVMGAAIASMVRFRPRLQTWSFSVAFLLTWTILDIGFFCLR